jgi:Na+/melibiose symporter-like transporter
MKLFLLVAMQIKFRNCINSAQFIFTSDNLGHLSLPFIIVVLHLAFPFILFHFLCHPLSNNLNRNLTFFSFQISSN